MSDCHDPQSAGHQVTRTIGSPLIALVGQPNVGKSTVFNLLTGMNQHVGNWPGKTVERKEGRFSFQGKKYTLVDLPGTYSLSANSAEELITRDFIVTQHPDLVMALVNAASLERSLYLVAELVSLSVPLLVVLNMMDVAKQEGYRIEPNVLQAALGVPVISFTATHVQNTQPLLQAISDSFKAGVSSMVTKPTIRADHQQVLDEVTGHIQSIPLDPYPRDWIALKLLEGDTEITNLVRSKLPADEWEGIHEHLRAHDDAQLAIASGRYEWIGRMTRAALFRPAKNGARRTLKRTMAHS